MARWQENRRTAHPPRKLGKGDNRTGEGDSTDGDAEAHLDLGDRADAVADEQAERARIEISRPAHQHRGKPDQRVEGRDELRHRSHGNAAGDDEADHRADCNGDEDFNDIGDVVRHQRRHHRYSHADHAEAVARPACRGRGQAAQREDEEHARHKVCERDPRVHRLAGRSIAITKTIDWGVCR